MRSLKKIFLGILAPPVLVTGFFMAAGCDRTPPAAPSAPLPQVVLEQVESRELMLTTQLPGRTSAHRIAQVRPQVSGLIQKRLFTEGSTVKAGEILYQIDPAPFQAALDTARANLLVAQKSADQARSALKAAIADTQRVRFNLELARTNQQRYETLFEKNFISAIQRDQAITEAKSAQSALDAANALVESKKNAILGAQAAVEQSRAMMKTARINLSYTAITAPIPGRIGRSTVTEGAIVTGYQPMALATIQQMDPIFVDVPQSTIQLLRLRQRLKHGRLSQNGKAQDTAGLILEDGSVYPIEGTLKFQEINVDPTTGSVILRAIFPNPDHILLPGMFVRAVIKEGTSPDAILIPQQAVSRDPKGNPVTLLVDKNNTVYARTLVLDRAIHDKWLVSSGIEPGERLIVEGIQKVRPGMVVNVVSPEPDPPTEGGL